MKNIKFFILIIILIVITFITIIQYKVFISTIHPNIWQAVMLLVMFVAIAIPFQQLWEVEEGKVLVAITSLIEEMEYNKMLLDGYIQHSEVGANVTPKNGVMSWEWNKPRFGAYERYLITACRENLNLAKDITYLYNRLEACKVIIEAVQHFVAINLVNCIQGGNPLFNSEIAKNNKQLWEISKEAKDLIPGLIKKLESKGGFKMREPLLKGMIGIFYCIIFIMMLGLKSVDVFWVYIAISFLGLACRAFYYVLIHWHKTLPSELVRHCLGSYFMYYPIMLSAVLGFLYLILIKKYNINIKDIPFIPVACIFLYIGFDIYGLYARLLKISLKESEDILRL